MQINFYMLAEDQALLYEHIYNRDGYLIPREWPEHDVPIFSADSPLPTRNSFAALNIYRENLFGKDNFRDPDWITPYHDGFFVHGPGMEYLPSRESSDGLHHGRIYMGLLGPSSFGKPGTPYNDLPDDANDRYRAMENFYRSCCRLLRKRFRRDDAGVYHGPSSDKAEAGGLAKLP